MRITVVYSSLLGFMGGFDNYSLYMFTLVYWDSVLILIMTLLWVDHNVIGNGRRISSQWPVANRGWTLRLALSHRASLGL